jgi:uncharacterized membrane protein
MAEGSARDSGSSLHRSTVIASGLLCCGLAFVVLFTNRAAFFSPLTVIVVSAIGLVAVLLQLRFYNRTQRVPIQAPMWLNVLGVVLALIALFSDRLRIGPQLTQILALAAVGIFAISSAIILHAFRKNRMASK